MGRDFMLLEGEVGHFTHGKNYLVAFLHAKDIYNLYIFFFVV